ncbi:hypothetical protein HGRIS_006641 [Hohenbuehelia grisea]|uniref:Mug135-like C-terminal domain-containing protein n=1 Tax=Hohenbuehelia grisea TaxID=104357 RepID=A0ABR3J9V6_9AGAR
MIQRPEIVYPLSNIQNFTAASRYAEILWACSGLSPDHPLYVDVSEAYEAKARAIQLACFVHFDDIPNQHVVAPDFFREMETRINSRIDTVEAKLVGEILQLKQVSLKALNGARDDGTILPYELIPFKDGTMPAENPLPDGPLPSLTTVGAITALTNPQASAYLQGYGAVEIPELLEDRHKLIAELIGVPVAVLKVRFKY